MNKKKYKKDLSEKKRKSKQINTEYGLVWLDHKGYYRYCCNDELVHRKIYKRFYLSIPDLWHVHHIDKNVKNNHISNLIALPEDLHKEIHFQMKCNNRSYNKKEIFEILKNNISNQENIEKMKQRQSELIEEFGDIINEYNNLSCKIIMAKRHDKTNNLTIGNENVSIKEYVMRSSLIETEKKDKPKTILRRLSVECNAGMLDGISEAD